MAYTVMPFIVMARYSYGTKLFCAVFPAYHVSDIVIAYTVVAYLVMASIVVAYVVMLI